MKNIQRMMGPMKSLVFGLAALGVAVTAAPAPAAAYDRDEAFRECAHHEAPSRQEHGRLERERWEHRNFKPAYRPPYVASHCFTQPGYWTWDGWQYVWVQPGPICR